MSFQNVHFADFKAQPKKSAPQNLDPKPPRSALSTGKVIATEPLKATLLPPRPAILGQTDSQLSDLDPYTGWAMLSTPDGVRLWPVRGPSMEVTPLLFKADAQLIPVFVRPEQGCNHPEIVLLNPQTGEVMHYRRISFVLSEQASTATVPLKGETITRAISCGSSVVCATNAGHLFLIKLRDVFGAVGSLSVHQLSKSWFNWGESPVVDMCCYKQTVACLRQSGLVSFYSVGATFSHLQDINLRHLDLSGQYMSIGLDDHLYVLTASSDVIGSSGGALARVNISNVLLEEQLMLPDITSHTQPRLFVTGNLQYILFNDTNGDRLVVIDWPTADANAMDTADTTINSLVNTVKSLNSKQVHTAKSLYFQSNVRVLGCRALDEGALLLTSVGVIEVDGSIEDATLKSLVEQAVFFGEENPLTFQPSVEQAVANEGNATATRAVTEIAQEIASSIKVPPVPNILAHLELRRKYLTRLYYFSSHLGLDNDANVALQNTYEKLSTVIPLASQIEKVSSDPTDWALYHTDKVVDLLGKVDTDKAIQAIHWSLVACSPAVTRPGVRGYWLASTKVLDLLKTTRSLTPDYAEVACTALAYASGDGSISTSRSLQQENQILKDLASHGHYEKAAEIALRFELWAPLATLSTDQWLNNALSLEDLSETIDKRGYEFARLIFDHLKSVDKLNLVTTVFGEKYEDFVYRYFSDEPKICWALDRLSPTRKYQTTKTLARACAQEQDPKQKLVLTSLLLLESLCDGDTDNYNAASFELAVEYAKEQVHKASRTPNNPGFAALVKTTDDVLLKLIVLPASVPNYVRAINLLAYQGTDAHKRLLAQQIVLNTQWDSIDENALLYRVLWSELVEQSGVRALEPFLNGDLQVTTNDVNELNVPHDIKGKFAVEIASANKSVQQLEDIAPWIQGALRGERSAATGEDATSMEEA